MLAEGRRLMQRVMTLPHDQRDERVAWVEALQPLLQSLDRSGVTWAWVNGHALQGGTLAGGRLAASGGTYRAVLLPDVDRIERASLAALAELAASGVPVLLSGRQPVEQPGFDPGGEGDGAVRLGVSRLIGAGAQALEPGESALFAALGPQRFPAPRHPSGSNIERYSRALPDGTRIHFFANQSAAEARVDLAAAPDQPLWWFDALEGRAWPARPGVGGLPLSLRGFESRFLLEGVTMPAAVPPGPSSAAALEGARRQWLLNDWHFVSGDYVADRSALIDWRDDEALRHARSGRYTHVLDLDEKREHARYILDLGLVQGSAAVSVNGRELGRASIPPFTLDITLALSPGENRIEIEVLAPLRNHFVGRALSGESQYSHMLVYRDQLVAAGLMGPVLVGEVAEQ